MNSPVTLPRLRTVERVESRQVSEPQAGRRRVSVFEVSLLAVWRNALMTLSTRAPLVLPLVLALAGVHMTVTLAGFEQPPAQSVPVGGVVEMLIQTAIYGALTWIGLQGTRAAPLTGRRLYRALGARWLTLLPSALVSGALFLAMTTGLATLPRAIVDDLTARLSLSGTVTTVAPVQQIATRDATVKFFYTLMPNPGLPFPNPLEWHVMLLAVPDDPVASACGDYSHQQVDPWRTCGDVPQRRLRIDQLSGLVLLVAADLLLRFRVLIYLLPIGVRRRGRLRAPLQGLMLPLTESVGMVLRHLLVVGLHVWVLRLTIACMGVIFIVLPSILVQWPVVPNPLAGVLGYPMAYLLVNVLSSAATTLISALVVAFCTLYDARLFVALSRFTKGAYQESPRPIDGESYL